MTKSGHAWVADFMGDPALMLMYQTDLSVRDSDASVEGILALERGMPVPYQNRPQFVWPDKRAKHRNDLPPLFCSNGFWLVSQRVADIMRQFDLGDGDLHAVEVREKDGKKRLDETRFCWIFGNRKDALDSDASANLRLFRDVPGEDRRLLASKPADDDVALAPGAALGPDVWLEKRLKKAVFLCGALGDALVSDGLGKALRLTRVRIL